MQEQGTNKSFLLKGKTISCLLTVLFKRTILDERHPLSRPKAKKTSPDFVK